MDLREIITYLVNIDDNQWYQYMFANETLNPRISDEKRSELTEKARQRGENIFHTFSAEQLQNDFGNLHITDTENISNGIMQYSFATFQSPNKVTLNKYVIEKTDELIESYQLQDLLGGVSAHDVLVQHEFFHYLEEKYPDVCLCDEKICLWQVLGKKHEMTVNCLSEIAGNTFVKNTLNLNYNPQLFDIVFSYAVNEDSGRKVFNYLLHLFHDDAMISKLNYQKPHRHLTIFSGKRFLFKPGKKAEIPAHNEGKGG